VLRERGERGPARVAETEEFRGLVEGLARRVVLGLAEDPVAPDARNLHQHRVPARDLQGHERKVGRVRLEPGGEKMSLQVMHAHHRHAPGIAERTPEAGADEQRPDQPRARRIRNPVNGLRPDARLG
jgi:hypothetical protein